MCWQPFRTLVNGQQECHVYCVDSLSWRQQHGWWTSACARCFPTVLTWGLVCVWANFGAHWSKNTFDLKEQVMGGETCVQWTDAGFTLGLCNVAFLIVLENIYFPCSHLQTLKSMEKKVAYCIIYERPSFSFLLIWLPGIHLKSC